MTLKQLKYQIIFRFIFAPLLIVFTALAVEHFGWGVVAILFSLLATNDIVVATNLLKVYQKIKDSLK